MDGLEEYLSLYLLLKFEDKRKKWLCYWCGAKYGVRHKCMKSKLYQILLEPGTEGDTDEFQECSEQLEDMNLGEESTPGTVLSLHAIQGSQDIHTMRVAANIGHTRVILLIDSVLS
ncbi:hypothetical protein PVK06_040962 [Gossypium arboreum]|uniref:Uncharacterized protein n=1 Tax=Gossypium arboreum TaxID=29729 RepID=A0ABR0N6W3_GOSAR|nr:hypothetical protein PVK06_040962 [Gossypium arboreum]